MALRHSCGAITPEPSSTFKLNEAGHVDKQLAGSSIVMTIIWVSVVLSVIYWMS